MHINVEYYASGFRNVCVYVLLYIYIYTVSYIDVDSIWLKQWIIRVHHFHNDELGMCMATSYEVASYASLSPC